MTHRTVADHQRLQFPHVRPLGRNPEVLLDLLLDRVTTDNRVPSTRVRKDCILFIQVSDRGCVLRRVRRGDQLAELLRRPRAHHAPPRLESTTHTLHQWGTPVQPFGVPFDVWASATTSTPWSTSRRHGTCSNLNPTGCPTSSARFSSPTRC